MYEKKKILVKTAFEQAKKELKKENAAKNYLAEYLSAHFEDLFGSAKTDKMFERYYTDLVQKNKDRYIDEITQDQLSKYIGYNDYDDFCKNFTFTKTSGDSTTVKVSINDDEESISEKFSKILITVTNSPIFNIPEFLTKHSNLGIIGVILCGGLVVGGKLYKADDKTPEVINSGNRQGFLTATKQCMYWNGKEYIPEYCNDTKDNLIAIDPKKIANFKKITHPDTIKSVKGIWYSKYQNEVEFFTNNGVNPENKSDLRPVTNHILEKYGKKGQ